jgi:hypothetical protein
MLAQRVQTRRVPVRVLVSLREEVRPQLVEQIRAFYGHRLDAAMAERVADELLELALTEADSASALRDV